jgi:hypothetical protein
MSQPEHSVIIANAAKAVLTPLGFRRKGRSRVWLGDRGYWLSVVEFQPSGFSKGSYLNTSAHWLWSPNDTLSFDYQLPDMKRPFIAFESREQFEPAARDLAALAASEVKRLDQRLSSFDEIARVLVERSEHISALLQGPDTEWSALHAAVALGILGDRREAIRRLDDFLAGERATFLGGWGPLARESLSKEGFPEFIKRTINAVRAGYGLPAWHAGF